MCSVVTCVTTKKKNTGFPVQLKTINELKDWMDENGYKVDSFTRINYLPKKSIDGGLFYLSGVEYNCYLFKDKKSFDGFNMSYLELTSGLLIVVFKWEKQKAMELINTTKFKEIHNAKCATNPGYVPI